MKTIPFRSPVRRPHSLATAATPASVSSAESGPAQEARYNRATSCQKYIGPSAIDRRQRIDISRRELYAESELDVYDGSISGVITMSLQLCSGSPFGPVLGSVSSGNLQSV